MNRYQRIVISVTAILVAIRLLFPTDIGTSLLHALGIAALGVGLYFAYLRAPSRKAYVVLITLVLVAVRLLVPAQGWPMWSDRFILEPTLGDRFLLTLGIWHRQGWTVPPNWIITLSHVALILTAGTVVFLRFGRATSHGPR